MRAALVKNDAQPAIHGPAVAHRQKRARRLRRPTVTARTNPARPSQLSKGVRMHPLAAAVVPPVEHPHPKAAAAAAAEESVERAVVAATALKAVQRLG